MNKTKIIATVGPSCSKKDILQEMVDSGVGTFRINMSHGDIDSKKHRSSDEKQKGIFARFKMRYYRLFYFC